jgi:hypothetical protein
MSEADPVGRTFLAVIFSFPFFPYSGQKAKMSMELKTTDLMSISSVLEHVHLPVVLGNIQNDALLVWNSAFQKRVGLSENELACTSFASLLILEESARNPITQSCNSRQHDILLPCVLRTTPLTNVYGQALRCDDGMLLAMLDVTLWDLASKGFDQGLRMGCEEERNRTRHFFHDVLSSKILVASFLAHEIHQNLAASGAKEAEGMARLTQLLQEAIEAIVHGAEEY